MEEEKTKGQLLAEELFVEDKSIVEKDPSVKQRAIDFCEGYKKFLANKTEREVISYVLPIITKAGYKEYVPGTKYEPGDKFYKVNRGKTIMMCTKGRRPIADGIRTAVAHIDSPRLDLKPHSLFESGDMAFLKTHYYGGIKKFLYLTIPLSIHGVVYKTDGTSVTVKIGEDDNDPTFCITDLLIHLSQKLMRKPAAEVIEGEQLNLLVGTWPFDDDQVKEPVKLAIMQLLNEKYGIKEADFETAELTLVPAVKPRDMGLDRSMVSGYGQDDSVCAYAQFMAELDTKEPEFTTMTVFCDKEETGSDGVTGMRSFFFRDFVEDLAEDEGCSVRHVMEKSVCLSCDVGSAYDPNFPDVFEKNNTAYLNHGPVIAKYDGARGKSGTSDASAELMNFILSIFRDAGVTWQIAELGRIDVGGGGTISSEITCHNIDTLDIGVPVLAMHSPNEVTAKVDIYMMYRAVLAFYNSRKAKDY